MPLPLLPLIALGASAIAGAVGVGKGAKAIGDNSRAKDLNEEANRIIENAKEKLEVAKKKSNDELESLGRNKVEVLENSIMRFVREFEKLKNVELQETTGLKELAKFKLDKQSITELKEMDSYINSALGGVTGGALGGALTAFGAFGLAGTIGTASTGTAISALGGAAAMKATLAFLGGGALSAGGLGVAGGMTVLGGLVAGPALAIMGFVMGAKAEENLHKAYSNVAEAKKAAEELNLITSLCDGIYMRAKMFNKVLSRLDALFVPMIDGAEKAIERHDCDYGKFAEDERKNLCAAASLAKAIKTVLDTPLLTEEGKLTDESESVAEEMRMLARDLRSNE